MENLKKNKIIYILLCLIIFSICIIMLFFIDKKKNNNNDYSELDNFDDNTSENTAISDDIKEQELIYVHITGEVVNPGVIVANNGDRIANIIEKAGGITQKADLKKVNLAFKVEDGQKINIPSVDSTNEENKEQKNDTKDNCVNDRKDSYITKSGGENVVIDGKENNNEKEGGKVNINTATQTELETLTGIGPSTASKIIRYRNEKGKFKKIEDIKNVSGIGEAKFKKIEADIVV